MTLEEQVKEAVKNRTTECECANVGFCKRHMMEKPLRFFQLCNTRKEYFQLWEECKGPGQLQNCHEYRGLSDEELKAKLEMEEAVSGESQGLGDTIAKLAHATGMDKLVKKGGCSGCNKRREWLNQSIPYKPKNDNK